VAAEIRNKATSLAKDGNSEQRMKHERKEVEIRGKRWKEVK